MLEGTITTCKARVPWWMGTSKGVSRLAHQLTYSGGSSVTPVGHMTFTFQDESPITVYRLPGSTFTSCTYCSWGGAHFSCRIRDYYRHYYQLIKWFRLSNWTVCLFITCLMVSWCFFLRQTLLDFVIDVFPVLNMYHHHFLENKINAIF